MLVERTRRRSQKARTHHQVRDYWEGEASTHRKVVLAQEGGEGAEGAPESPSAKTQNKRPGTRVLAREGAKGSSRTRRFLTRAFEKEMCQRTRGFSTRGKVAARDPGRYILTAVLLAPLEGAAAEGAALPEEVD